MRRAFWVVIFVAGCGVATRGRLTRDTLHAPAATDYVHELKARAHQLGLARKTQWLRLGHYRPVWTGDLESQADGDNFFLSKIGKSHPEAELDATIDGFFSELAPFTANEDTKNVQHPICQFPARFRWLSRELQIDPAKLPPHDCSRFDEFVKSVQAESASVVFSSYYLNNPASAFGHTFIRLSKHNPDVPEDRRQLLDYGIDYGADPDTTFAPVYAIKGIAGAFPGTFRKVPFYFKVREYNDFESRDLWIYNLKLTQDQLDMLVAHMWELGSTFFDYFYLSENCSYHIIGLIDAAAPEYGLIDRLHWPSIPADSIKALNEAPGLVAKVDFRPSARTRFRHELQGMSGEQADAILKLIDNPAAPVQLAERDRIQVLDAAQDLVDIRYAKDLIQDSRDTDGARLKQRLLERRAAILVPSQEEHQEIPWSKMPQLGHDSRRVQLGAGADTGSGRYAALGARLALHDLADPAEGYPDLSQLEFLPTRARYDWAERRFHLDQLDLVHIVSLTSQDRFDRHVSWEVRFGSQRIEDAGCKTTSCYAAHAQVGSGGALATANQALTLFVLGETHVWSGPRLDGIAGAPIRAGVGATGGLRIRFTPHIVSLLQGEWDWLPKQTGFATWNFGGILRMQLFHDVALDLEARDENRVTRAVASTMLYF